MSILVYWGGILLIGVVCGLLGANRGWAHWKTGVVALAFSLAWYIYEVLRAGLL